MAASEKELPLEGTATVEGILSASLFFFLVNHIDIILTSAWMTSAETAATSKDDTFSNIAKMITDPTKGFRSFQDQY